MSNGIWLYLVCAVVVDQHPAKYSEPLLQEWKVKAEREATAYIGRRRPSLWPHSQEIVVYTTLFAFLIAGIPLMENEFLRFGTH